MQLSHNIIDLVNYTQCKSTEMNWWPSIADIPNILHSMQRQILWIYNIFKFPNLCTFDVHRFSEKKNKNKSQHSQVKDWCLQIILPDQVSQMRVQWPMVMKERGRDESEASCDLGWGLWWPTTMRERGRELREWGKLRSGLRMSWPTATRERGRDERCN